ncbi:cyclophilin-like fold protein [Serratia odorifera]|nr:cyclophilin-like fold protein [Serratia odorifera]
MSNTTHHQDTPMKLNIIIDGYARTATLNHSQASKDFVALLPLTLTLQDYAATEKISVLPSRLTVSDSPAGTAARKGDITFYAPWGNLALFYQDHGYASGLVKLGQFDEPGAVPSQQKSCTARFELAQ